jgi:hypothetical protein
MNLKINLHRITSKYLKLGSLKSVEDIKPYLEDCLSRIKSTTGLAFKVKIFEVGNNVILELKNQTKETTIKGYVSKTDGTEKWVMSWEGDMDLTFPDLESLLDQVPNEYDTEISLFETKESFDDLKKSIAQAMGPQVGRLKWKLERTKSRRTLYVSGKDNARMYLKTCTIFYNADTDNWALLATLQITREEDRPALINIMPQLKNLALSSYDPGKGELVLNLKGLSSSHLLISTIESIFDVITEEIN